MGEQGEREWAFLLDENVPPRVKHLLEKEGFSVETVGDALGFGADDEAEILPYAREQDRVLVTQDITDFGRIDPADHHGLILIHDQRRSAFEIAVAIMDLVEAYGRRKEFLEAPLDAWF